MVKSGKLFERTLMDKALTVCKKIIFCNSCNRHTRITAGGFETYQIFADEDTFN